MTSALVHQYFFESAEMNYMLCRAKRTTCHACIASIQAVSTACSISKHKVKEEKSEVKPEGDWFIYQLGKLICSSPWRNHVKASSHFWCEAKTFHLLSIYSFDQLSLLPLLYFTNLSQNKSNTSTLAFHSQLLFQFLRCIFLSHFLFPLQL